MLQNFVPFYNAYVADRLEQEEGVLLGKLNLDEFATGCSNESSAFHLTYNPWNLNHVPGGSSGGSAASVAAGQVAFALGSDTGGSIRQPASFCGVVGMKTTYGRVSRWGVAALASSLDQVGILAKDVADCALVLQAIAGYDRRDSNCIDRPVPVYTDFLTGDIKGLKIGYPKEYFVQGVMDEVKQAVMSALRQYEGMGAIVEEVSLPYSEYALPAYQILCSAEASANLAMFDGVRYGQRDFEAEMVADMFAGSRSKYFGKDIKNRIMLGTYALSAGYYDAYYVKAQKVRRLIADDFNRVFKGVDLIVTPTTPQTAFKIGEFRDSALDMIANDRLAVPVNMAGLPAMTVPCGFHNGMPIGMQLIGKALAEDTMLQAAYAFERQNEFYRMRPALGGK